MTASLPQRRSRAAGLFASLALAGAVIVGASASAAAASHDIAIVDFAFDPVTQTVVVGEPVTWTNNGSQDHTVTSDQGSELDSDEIRPGEAYGHVFERPGAYAYHCEIHPDDMTGTITVTAAASTPIASGTPEPTPPAGTLPPNFSPFPSTGPLESSAPSLATASPSDPGAGGLTGGTGPQFLVLAFIGAALLGVIAVIVIRRRRGTKA